MTDMVHCYGSADGVTLKAQSLYREKFLGCQVLHSQTFLVFVQWLRVNCTFRPRSVDRVTPRVLHLEPQILETVEENPAVNW
jgi:mannitol-1-phosphate/altronate dehydrogenase